MEERQLNVMINKAGGNASPKSLNYRITIPSLWAKEMGISKKDKSVKVTFDGEEITIRKDQKEG